MQLPEISGPILLRKLKLAEAKLEFERIAPLE